MSNDYICYSSSYHSIGISFDVIFFSISVCIFFVFSFCLFLSPHKLQRPFRGRSLPMCRIVCWRRYFYDRIKFHLSDSLFLRVFRDGDTLSGIRLNSTRPFKMRSILHVWPSHIYLNKYHFNKNSKRILIFHTFTFGCWQIADGIWAIKMELICLWYGTYYQIATFWLTQKPFPNPERNDANFPLCKKRSTTEPAWVRSFALA